MYRTNLIDSKHKSLIAIFIFLNLLLALVETIGIGSLPIIILSLLDQGNFDSYFFSKFISKYFDITSPDFLYFFSFSVFIFFLIKNLYYLLIKWFEGLLKREIVSNTSSRLFKNYLLLPFSQHQYKNPSIIIRNMTNNCDNYASYITSIIDLVRESLIILFLFSLLFFQNKILSSAVLLTLISVLALFYFFIRNILYKMGRISENYRGEQLKLINQSLEAIRYVKILSKESFLLKKFSNNLNKILNQAVIMNVVKSAPKTILEVMAIGIMLISVYFFLNYSSLDNIVPFITLLGLILVRFIPSFNIISSALSSLKFLTPSKEILIEEFRNSYRKKDFENKSFKKKSSKLIFNNFIEFKNVSYKYPSSKNDNIKNISLKIKKNSFVAFIGESGAGKSTIVDLILGLLKPKSGKIYIDNNDLQSCLKDWYPNIGFIPQDIYLDDDTIKNNITFYDEKINYKNLRNASEKALLNRFINSLPDKIDTYIGNRGIRLSGGQIQRIGIARCIYRNPKVIIMDEATSSLDNKAEKKILEAIKNIKKERTLIAIAHRLSTVKSADVIYFVKDGKIIDYGSYENLKKSQKGFFINS